jgi:phage terminase small subunit
MLTPKQRRFVDEYLIDLNATQAAIRAGYKGKRVDQTAHENLRKPEIAAAIQAGRERVAEKAEVTAVRVLSELALIGHSDIGDILDFTGVTPRLKDASAIPEGARRTISSIKIKREVEGVGDKAREVEVIEFKRWNKNKALEDLAKHLGILKEKVEVSGEVKVNHGFDLSKLSADELNSLRSIVASLETRQAAGDAAAAADGQ